MMFVRLRWFTIGAIASFGMVAYVANQLRRARRRLTAENMARGAARSAASALDAVARRVAPQDRSG